MTSHILPTNQWMKGVVNNIELRQDDCGDVQVSIWIKPGSDDKEIQKMRTKLQTILNKRFNMPCYVGNVFSNEKGNKKLVAIISREYIVQKATETFQ